MMYSPTLFPFQEKKKKALIITLLLIIQIKYPPTTESEQSLQHVVLIAIDCVNPTTLQQAYTPNIDLLIASGSYTFSSCTVTPANTISAIPAIFTGAPQEVHQLYQWTGTMQAESIIEVLEESGYSCALVGESENLGGYAASYCTGFYYRTDHDEYYFDIAVDWIVEYEPFFMFIYTPMPDRAGHQYGLGSEEYEVAIETADYHIGRVIETLQDQGVYDETLIVVTTDHSLQGTSHSRGPTFSVWKGPGIREDYEMDESSEYVAGYGWVSHTLDDVAPTILYYLGLRQLSDATGGVISSILVPVPEPEPEHEDILPECPRLPPPGDDPKPCLSRYPELWDPDYEISIDYITGVIRPDYTNQIIMAFRNEFNREPNSYDELDYLMDLLQIN